MLSNRQMRLSLLVSAFFFLSYLLPTAATSGQDGSDKEHNVLDESEMDLKHGKDPALHPKVPPDDETKQQFVIEYKASGSQKRPVYDKYLPKLGAEWLLDFLEDRHALCHEQAHELGQAIFVLVKEIGPALVECGTRCTSGCMHGVLMQAFGEKNLDDIKKQMVAFCREGEIAKIHKPGNCAHGIGHAFMAVSGGNVEKSLTYCSSFPNPAMQYYCATGVFMQYFTEVQTNEKRKNPKEHSIHFPCDTYTQFPAACYRYKVYAMRKDLVMSRADIVNECLSLPHRLRLGCFHGLGAAFIDYIAITPGFISEVCAHGTPEDQAICIEGAIEKLADFNEQKALAACTTLSGKNADICEAAAKGKMYSLDKPTMKLYSGQ